MSHCLVRQLEKQVDHLQAELSNIACGILSLEHEDTSLFDQESALDKALFDLSLQIEQRLSDQTGHPPTHEISSSIKPPKINVSTFNGNIVNCSTFWQQFDVAAHSKTQLNDTKKLAYLKDALKDKPARQVIEGLMQDEKYYKEAIGCLQRHYDRPHLIHQAHVHILYEALFLRDANSCELCCLHDIAAPHFRALKTTDYEPSGSFITSTLELKLDPTTMFEWLRHSQDSREVPHYTALLEFLDLQVHASGNTISDTEWKRQTAAPGKKLSTNLSYHVNINDTCVACKLGKHPL